LAVTRRRRERGGVDELNRRCRHGSVDERDEPCYDLERALSQVGGRWRGVASAVDAVWNVVVFRA
jgi:hypothetical protein